MKFGKRLRDLLEDSLPEWRNKFLSYKELKKTLKSLPSGDGSPGLAGPAEPAASTPESSGIGIRGLSEELFVQLLNDELEKFNSFFMEKEEEFVIRMQVLREEINRVRPLCPNGDLSQCWGCGAEVNDLRKAIVSLHGEMVLLENYSALNYTGLVKILKKHDKRTGLLLRYPFISTVLRQPFLTTDILSKLVKECEQRIQTMFPSYSSAGSQADDREGAESCLDGDRESTPSSPENSSGRTNVGVEDDMEAVYKSALTALRSLQEIRGSSKTPHPLLAEAASYQGVTFHKPRDTESNANADGQAGKGVGSVSSTPGRPSLGDGRPCEPSEGPRNRSEGLKETDSSPKASDVEKSHGSHENFSEKAQGSSKQARELPENAGDLSGTAEDCLPRKRQRTEHL